MTKKVDCYACRGTGIGLHGDPDTSKCTPCRGRGYTFTDDDDADRDYEDWLDRRLDRLAYAERMRDAADIERKQRKGE